MSLGPQRSRPAEPERERGAVRPRRQLILALRQLGDELAREIPLPPLAAVVAPWAASRALVLAATLAAREGPLPDRLASLAEWDGAWYLDIARRGYGFVHLDGQTPYPFFPLLPLVIRAAIELGLPAATSAIAVNSAALLLALWGLQALLKRRFPAEVAACATWSLALYPGSAPFSMVYPSAILLAACVWAFHEAEVGDARRAGALGVVAALVRPNGLAVPLSAALGAGGLDRAAWVALPGLAAVVTWMAVLGAWTGDPLVFLSAKAGWKEVTLLTLLAGQEKVVPKIDLGVAAIAFGALALEWRRLPIAWRVFAALWLVPPLFLGLLGIPRYSASCFVVFAACGLALARVRPALRVAALVAFGAGQWFLTARIVTARMLP